MPVRAAAAERARPAADERRKVRPRPDRRWWCRSSTSGRCSTSTPTCRAATSLPPRPIDEVIAADRPAARRPITVTLSGQVETMRESYHGLFSGMALAVVLVYLFW